MLTCVLRVLRLTKRMWLEIFVGLLVLLLIAWIAGPTDGTLILFRP